MKKKEFIKSGCLLVTVMCTMFALCACGSKAEKDAALEVNAPVAVEEADVPEVVEDTAELEAAEKVVPVEETAAVEELPENPGSFETADYSVSYDTEKWYGRIDENSVATINCLVAEAGTSYIEISKSDFATAKEAIDDIAKTKGQNLTEPSQIEKNGCNIYVTWNDIPRDTEGPVLDDFYLVFEKDGKVIVVDECITRDSDDSRAEELSYVFDDVVDTIQVK